VMVGILQHQRRGVVGERSEALMLQLLRLAELVRVLR